MSNNIPTGSCQWGCSQSNTQPGASSSTVNDGLMSIDTLIGNLGSLGTGADLAFLVYAMQIKKMDQKVADSLKEIQQTSSLRDALSKELAGLRKLKSLVDAHGTDGEVHVGKLVVEHSKQIGRPIESSLSKYKNDPAYKKEWDSISADLMKSYPFRETNVSLDGNGHLVYQKGASLSKNDKLRASDVQTRIDNIKDKITKLDSDREVRMILLNQTLNKKGNVVSQLTNIIKKTHTTQQSIISNLR